MSGAPHQTLPLKAVRSEATNKPPRNRELRYQAQSSAELRFAREAICARLDSLWRDHRNLEIALTALQEWSPLSDFQVRELKKRKLAIKDAIASLYSTVQPMAVEGSGNGI